MTTYQTIPLTRLVHSKANVRITGRKDGIAELAASIDAHGLQQNLNVLPTTSGRYEVVAGGRRLQALKLLAKAGRLAKDYPVACRVLEEGDNPAELSLVENSLRLAMHPDDQCEAFRALIEEDGMNAEDVAARFGVTPAVVRRRLKLANVAPTLRALYRKGEMTLEHVMALAISDDHVAQQEAWDNLPAWNRDPSLLKDALTGEAVPLTDKLARFIGVEAYEAAGGGVLRDLFDEENEGYLPDRALVQRLAGAKAEEMLTALRAEGWKWAVFETSYDYDTRYGRLYPQSAQVDEGEDEELADEAVSCTYAPEEMAQAGVRVMLGHDGTLRVECGWVHPDDRESEERSEGTAPRKPANPADLAAGVVESLTAHRTAALRIELARNPAVALAAVVHGLALSLLYPCSGRQTCLALRAGSERLDAHTDTPDDSPAQAAMAAEGERWGDHLPGNPEGLWEWCLAQPQDVLLDLLAYLTALSVNAVRQKHDTPHDARLAHADQLADSLGLDMRQWWTPSVDGFYGRLSKAQLAHAVLEAGFGNRASTFAILKKGVAVQQAAHVLAGSGWLPAVLRAGQGADVATTEEVAALAIAAE